MSRLPIIMSCSSYYDKIDNTGEVISTDSIFVPSRVCATKVLLSPSPRVGRRSLGTTTYG